MAMSGMDRSRGEISYKNPTVFGILASAVLTALVILGSRNLEHFDPALFGYTIASIVALGAITFRYAVWLQRPATRAYFWRGLDLFSASYADDQRSRENGCLHYVPRGHKGNRRMREDFASDIYKIK